VGRADFSSFAAGAKRGGKMKDGGADRSFPRGPLRRGKPGQRKPRAASMTTGEIEVKPRL
jgi:hypothetical protein